MQLKSRLESDLKAAVKGRDPARVSTLRLALAAVKQREIDSGQRQGLSEAEALGIIERLIKQRHEAAEQYRVAGREASAVSEETEARLLGDYLPEPIDVEALDAEIRSVIREAGAADRRDMGKVMGLLKARLAGRANMAEASRRVRELLTGQD